MSVHGPMPKSAWIYPALAVLLFVAVTAAGYSFAPSPAGLVFAAVLLVILFGTVFAAVHHAEVIAHEIGHHVQNLLGILPKVQAAQLNAASKGEANNLSVRVELMADCLAGVWAANAERKYQFLEAGDLETAVATAQAIGDDRLQKSAQGYAVPDSFTHGTAAQRVQWLNAGLKSGEVDSCNTFAR